MMISVIGMSIFCAYCVYFFLYVQERKEVLRICDENVYVLLTDVVANKSMGELTPICVYHEARRT